MSLITDSTGRHLEMALDLRYQRQQLLASNIANADTPNYKPMDLNFEGALKSVERNEAGSMGLDRTDGTHISTGGDSAKSEVDVITRSDVENTLDGNGVDLDREIARFAENKVHYEVAVESTRRRFAILNYVISTMATNG